MIGFVLGLGCGALLCAQFPGLAVALRGALGGLGARARDMASAGVSWLTPWWRWLALGVAALIVVLIVLNGFHLFGKSREQLRIEAQLAQQEAAMQAVLNQRDAVIAQAAKEAAVHRAQIVAFVNRGRNEIAAARPANEAPLDAGLVAAWRQSIERLCIYPSADGNRPDTCGPGAAG